MADLVRERNFYFFYSGRVLNTTVSSPGSDIAVFIALIVILFALVESRSYPVHRNYNSVGRCETTVRTLLAFCYPLPVLHETPYSTVRVPVLLIDKEE